MQIHWPMFRENGFIIADDFRTKSIGYIIQIDTVLFGIENEDPSIASSGAKRRKKDSHFVWK